MHHRTRTIHQAAISMRYRLCILLFFCINITFVHAFENHIQRLNPDSTHPFLKDIIIKKASLHEIKTSEPTQTNATLYIKNYGDGQLSTIQFRGFNATQNDVEWMGIPLQSPFNATTDLSLIPFQLQDEGYSFRNLGQTFSIAAETKPSGTNQNQQTLQLQARWYHLYQAKYHLTQEKPTEKIALDIDIKKGSNNYVFDRYGKSVNITNNDFEQYSLYSHYGKFSPSGQVFNGFYWWTNFTNRNIPPTLNQHTSLQSYKEFSLKTAYVRESKHILNTIYLEVNQSNYKDPAAYLFSNYRYQTIRDKFTFQQDVLNWNFRYQLLGMLDLIQSDAFTEIHFLANLYHRVSLSKTWSRHTFQWGFMMVSQQRKSSFPQPFAAYTYEAKQKQTFFKNLLELKLKTRYPSGNDLYWPLAGNTSLLPEQSFQISDEIHYQKTFANIKIFVGCNTFLYYTKNLINWVPNNHGIWAPSNVSAVLSYGINPQWNIQFPAHIHWSSQYQFNPVLNKEHNQSPDFNKQIIYTPKHKWSSELEWKYQKTHIRVTTIYTSERYYTTDNSLYLNPYTLVHVQAGYAFKNLQGNLRVENILNTSYQEITERPMPGIMPSISIKYIFQ